MQSVNIHYYLVFILIIFSASVNGQKLSTKSKKAEKAYINGENSFRIQDIASAEKYFLKAVEIDPDFFEAYMMLGDIYEKNNDDTSAVIAYNKAIEIDTTLFPAVMFLTANVEFKNGWYVGAAKHYSMYINSNGAYEKNLIRAKKQLANCNFAMQAMENPVPFDPKNLGEGINTNKEEYFPCITADNQTILFTRLLDDSRSYSGRQEDFFIAKMENGEWQKARNIGPPINSVYNEGAPSLSADGNILIFTACENVNGYGAGRDGFGRCDLFVSKKNGPTWTVPYNLGRPVNSSHWESQPSFSADGRTLYFVSNRNSGYDIYVSKVDNNGKWSEPEKLGPNINTSGYEGSVFIHPDNQTLYFSSDGHTGMGKMDIYLSRRDSLGNWGKAKNLGYPINTYKDENSIVVSADGQLALFASNRKNGYGGLDIYGFDLYADARPQPVTYMKGVVFDFETRKKLKASFELIDLETGKTIISSYSDPDNGEFLVCLPSNHNFALNVSREGYLFYSENFSLTGEHQQNEPVLKDIPLKPIKVGEIVILNNIFFESDKFDLKPESTVELEKLLEFMEKNPSIKIEISGHTDNVGSTAYNIELSENRAKAVYDFLIEKNISPKRLQYKGYGESQAIDSNDTESGKANNRRTEFKIVE
jgi:outer membrane protein OmpA-like peptidoglycan-associated protein